MIAGCGQSKTVVKRKFTDSKITDSTNVSDVMTNDGRIITKNRKNYKLLLFSSTKLNTIL